MNVFGQTHYIDSLEELYKIAPHLKLALNESKLILIRGLEDISKKELTEFALKLAQKNTCEESFLFWDFGYLMELKEDKEKLNYLFTRERVPFHWDGAFHQVPHILLFNSLSNIKEGATLFADTEKILAHLTEEELQKLDALSLRYSTEKKAHYGGSFTQKVLSQHPITGRNVLRLGEEVATSQNPVYRESSDVQSVSLLQKIESMLYQEEFCYTHLWQKGDILLADNFSLLHGRESYFEEKAERHLRRIQIK